MTDPLIEALVEWVKSAPESVRELLTQQTANVKGPKQAKADVNYRPADDSAKSCSTCSHYDGSNGCAVVSGHINPNHVSDLYTPGATSDTDASDPGTYEDGAGDDSE